MATAHSEAPPARIVGYDHVVSLLREGVAAAGSQRAYAWAFGIHEGDLGQVLRGRRLPSEKLCALVGVERQLVQTGEPISPVWELDLSGASVADEEIHALRTRLARLTASRRRRAEREVVPLQAQT